MDIKKVFTESPEDEQWRMLLYYAYPNNVQNYFKKNGKPTPSKEIIESISGSILQAREYFEASKTSSLQISPLLLYYGVSNLFYGYEKLTTASSSQIKDHGIKLTKAIEGRIADLELMPLSNKTGALTVFADLFGSSRDLPAIQKWTLLELLSSVPDILNDVLDCYSDAIPQILPVELIQDEHGIIDRIPEDSLKRFKSIDEGLSLIPDYNKHYLPPQQYSSYVLLRRKLTYTENKVFSLSGQKFIELYYLKDSKPFLPTMEIKLLMILFALGFVCRYHPELWNPFVRNDITGEKLIIEKFLGYIRRFIPNLVLNRLEKTFISFLAERYIDPGFIDKA